MLRLIAITLLTPAEQGAVQTSVVNIILGDRLKSVKG